MALTSRSPGQQPIDSSAINQYQQLLTGVMTDQPVTLANTLTVTKTVAGSSNLTVGGNITGSSGLTLTGTVAVSSGLVQSRHGSSTSSTPVQAFALGSSGPSIYWGTGVPVLACTVGSLYLNAGGSTTTAAYLCIPNSGGASSSNWDGWGLT